MKSIITKPIIQVSVEKKVIVYFFCRLLDSISINQQRKFLLLTMDEGQYIFGQSNGKPTLFNIDTGKTCSVVEKGEWIYGSKNGRQCWYNTETKETRFSSPIEQAETTNNVLPLAFAIDDLDDFIMDIDFTDDEKKRPKKRKFDEKTKKRRNAECSKRLRQQKKKQMDDALEKIAELEATVIELTKRLAVKDSKIESLHSHVTFLQSIVTSEMMSRQKSN